MNIQQATCIRASSLFLCLSANAAGRKGRAFAERQKSTSLSTHEAGGYFGANLSFNTFKRIIKQWGDGRPISYYNNRNMKYSFFFAALLWCIAPAAQATDGAPVLKLLFAGDIMGHSPQIKSAYRADTDSYDYEPCFQYVKGVVSQADLAIANLEVTLSDKGTYTGYPMFRSPDALASALQKTGFDLLVTANNHSNDGGLYGITHTLDVLDQQHFHYTGTFRNANERKARYPKLVYKNGFKLAFLNYTYGTNGLPTPSPAIVNLIDEAQIKTDFAEAKALEPDGIIVIMHWGNEYQINEHSTQADLAQKLIDWGADLVVGAHPHVVQPIKTLTTARGEQRFVAYSLGNFISNQRQPRTDGGIMLEVDLRKTPQGITVESPQYIPVWRYIAREGSQTTYYALPISAVENKLISGLNLSASALASLTAYAAHVRKHLSKYGAQERILAPIDLTTYTRKGISATFASLSANGGTRTVAVLDTFINGKYEVIARYKGQDGGQARGITPRTPATPRSGTYTPPLFAPSSNPVRTNDARPTDVPAPTVDQPTPRTPLPPTNGEPDPSQKAYTIQFQASRNLYPKSSLPFEAVDIEKANNGFYRYYTGTARTLDDAKLLLRQVKMAGFPDAFITEKKYIPNLEDGVKGMTPRSIDAVTYKVQFQSAKNYYNIDPKLFRETLVLEDDKGWFRYYTGTATDIATATDLLKAVQAKGFKDAFIVTFKDGKPVQ